MLTGVNDDTRRNIDDHFLISFAGALSDNGAISAASIMTDENWRPEEYMALGLLAAVPVYLMVIGVGLGVAHYAAYRQGVNTSGIPIKTKPKRAYALPDSGSAAVKTIKMPTKSETGIPMTPGAANIFALANAAHYRVEIFHYQRHLSRLLLRATHKHKTVYLQFSGVAYMDVPSVWQNASFRVGTTTEYHQVMQSTGTIANTITAESLRLYLVDTPEKTLRIIATSAVLLHELRDSAAQ